MSKRKITEYKCDVCGRVIQDSKGGDKNPLKQVSVPAKCYDCEGRSFSRNMCMVDMCDDCFMNYWTYVQSKYETSQCYDEINVEIHS